MQQPYYMQLNLEANEANRLYWNEQYFSVESVLMLPKQVETKDDAYNAAKECTLVVKLTPFKNQFRAKLLASLKAEESPENAKILGLTLKVDVINLQLIDILDCRSLQTTLDSKGNGNINVSDSEILNLTEKEKQEFKSAFEKLAHGNLNPHLKQPFISFFPTLADTNWEEKIPPRQKKASLVPFQAIFPYAGAIERFHDKQVFALDDLYCVNPDCDCNEVTCVVLTFDQKSGKEITHGGFKYHFEKKSFKNIPNFPSQFNAQEWFKQFNKLSPFQLSNLFESRYNFLRKKYNT